MSLKERIAARLKAKAAGEKANLSQKRIDAIVLRAEKGLTDESDDTQIDASLDTINELTPFKEIAALDDHQRAKDAKAAQDKEAARLKAIEEGKPEEVELPADTPAWMLAFMKQQAAQNKALEDKISAFSVEKVTNTRREQYAKTLENTSDAFKAKALKDFDRMKFDTDDQFSDFLTESAEDAKGFAQTEANDGLGGFKPMGGAGSKPAGTPKVATIEVVDEIMGLI